MKIETIDRGNGLTELRVKDKRVFLKRKKRKKAIAWSYLAFTCWLLIFGSIFVTPQARPAAFYTAYWIMTIVFTVAWLIANYIYGDFKVWLRKKLSRTK